MARFMRSSVGMPAYERQFDVVQRGGASQRVEGLEDETDFLVPDPGQFIIVEFADQLAVQPILALEGCPDSQSGSSESISLNPTTIMATYSLR